MSLIPAPDRLSPAARELWAEFVSTWDFSDPNGRTLLRVALENLDRRDEARAILAREGLTVTNRAGTTRAHPALRIERDAHSAMLGALKALRLETGPTAKPTMGRPPGPMSAARRLELGLR